MTREEKAIEVLSTVALAHKFSSHSLSTHADYELADALRTAIGALNMVASGGNTSEWIPVSDHNPTRIGTYLTTVDLGNYGRVSRLSYYCDDDMWDDNVVAWMPRPQPYREDK